MSHDLFKDLSFYMPYSSLVWTKYKKIWANTWNAVVLAGWTFALKIHTWDFLSEEWLLKTREVFLNKHRFVPGTKILQANWTRHFTTTFCFCALLFFLSHTEVTVFWAFPKYFQFSQLVLSLAARNVFFFG